MSISLEDALTFLAIVAAIAIILAVIPWRRN